MKSSVNSVPPVTLDIRSLFAAGISPCGTIDETVAKLKPGQGLVLVAPFEPVPLFTKLGAQGFGYHSEAQSDGSYRISFTRAADVPAATNQVRCCSEEV